MCGEDQSGGSWYGTGRDSESSAVARRQISNEGGDDNGLESAEPEAQEQTYDDDEFYPSDATM